MLHLAGDDAVEEHPPSSPIRRLVQPAFPSPQRNAGSDGLEEAEFVASSPAETKASESQGIKRDALSPGYFRRFFIEEKELGKGGKGVVLLVRHELDGVFLGAISSLSTEPCALPLTDCYSGHFACKRVPVGDDHAWLEKGTPHPSHFCFHLLILQCSSKYSSSNVFHIPILSLTAMFGLKTSS